MPDRGIRDNILQCFRSRKHGHIKARHWLLSNEIFLKIYFDNQATLANEHDHRGHLSSPKKLFFQGWFV